MKRIEHYQEAERLLAAAEAMLSKGATDGAALAAAQQIVVARAQVHATLAAVPVNLSVRDA